MQAFNLLYNNIASDKAPGLEPYEISRLLTDAQHAVVVALYKGTLGTAFEATEEVTSYLDTLVRQCSGKKVPQEDMSPVLSQLRIAENSTVFEIDQSAGAVLFRTWEGCTIASSCGDVPVPVIPVTQDEYWRTVRDPFKRQNNRRVLRLSFASSGSSEDFSVVKYSELVSDSEIKSYVVRYISRPSPIILETLPDGLTIDGRSEEMTCLLPEPLHQAILTEAVKTAKAIWNS